MGGGTPSKKTVQSVNSITSKDIPNLTTNGWFIGNTSIGPSYTATRNLTLEAKWTSNKNNLQFNSNCGESTLNSYDCTYDKVIPLPNTQDIINLTKEILGDCL